MKNIIISADGDRMVYFVPNIIADNLEAYCYKFYKWMKESAHASRYRSRGVVVYTEEDFIEYLNTKEFPQEPSIFIENLGPMGMDESPIPEKFGNCPRFDF